VRLAGQPTAGTKVFVTTEQGSRVAQIITGDSFQSQQPNATHFGLGDLERVKEVRVAWPNGKTTTLENPAVDRWHVVRR
jgi:hypothetical protein